MADRRGLARYARGHAQRLRRVRWLVVRNYRDGATLSLFDQSKSRARLLELGAIEVDLPCLVEVTRNRLQLANLTVGMGRDSDKLPLLDRSRCVQFHERVGREFSKASDLLLK